MSISVIRFRGCFDALVAMGLFLLLSFASAEPATARGGGHGGMGRGGGLMAEPAYVLILVSSITDTDGFKKTLQDLPTAVASFSGRLAIDLEKPVSWEGTASEYVAMIQFANTEQAQAWKNSDAFRSFDSTLHRSATSTMQLVQGLPLLGGRGAHLDAKAFEPNVKDYDRLLDRQLKAICKGC